MATREHVIVGRDEELAAIDAFLVHPIRYDLHVWLQKRNPSGVFAQWNPEVSCK